MKLHIAKEGETLERLATVYGVPVSLLRAANPHAAGGTLIRGSKVKIPYGTVKPAAAQMVRVSAESASDETEAGTEPVPQASGENENAAAEAAESGGSENAASAVSPNEANPANDKAVKKEVWTWSSFVKRSEPGQAGGASAAAPSAGNAAQPQSAPQPSAAPQTGQAPHAPVPRGAALRAAPARRGR